jgi:thiol-disulfide isomerase/thioredoxin
MGALEALVLSLALAGGHETVLLDFYGDACPPCRRMAPLVQQLTDKGYPVRKVNIDREPGLASQFGVNRIPCFVMLVDGREVHREVGEPSLSQLEQMCALGRSSRKGSGVPAQLVGAEKTGTPAVVIPAVQTRQPFTAPDSGRPAGPPANDGRTTASVPGWRLTSPDWAGNPGKQDSSARDLLAATVRLRIEDANGQSCGSGTIIDARGGQALILTCGHLFRDSQGKGKIEVDVFGPTPAERIPGRLVHYDLGRDLGLLAIRISGPVLAARVAPPGHPIAKGGRAISVGCDHGAAPTARQCTITSQDRFLGPPNLEASGLPVQGRSGGGLFSSAGWLIGVCNAAVPSDNEGLYAALGSIHAELDQVAMGFVYRSEDGKSGARPSATTPAPPAMPRQMPPASELVQWTDDPTRPAPPPAASAPDPPEQLRDNERAALAEIQRRVDAGAEIVCVIRSFTDPSAPSEVIVLNRVSPAFLRELMAGRRPAAQEPDQAGSGVPPSGRSGPQPGPSSVRATRSEAVPMSHASSAPQGGPPGDGQWHPRWLQPGYQGS